jgi:hypothetical protein
MSDPIDDAGDPMDRTIEPTDDAGEPMDRTIEPTDDAAPESSGRASEATGRSDPDGGESVAMKALDLFVFAPAGLLLTALEDLPEMVAKGRRRFELQFRNARFIGQFAVSRGQHELRERLTRSVTPRPPEREPGATAGPVPHRPQSPAPGWDGIEPIPGYDTLSASQVVRRLDGLGEGDLQAIVAYEGATRGRRTIVHRAQQLLGVEEPPGPAGQHSPVEPD